MKKPEFFDYDKYLSSKSTKNKALHDKKGKENIIDAMPSNTKAEFAEEIAPQINTPGVSAEENNSDTNMRAEGVNKKNIDTKPLKKKNDTVESIKIAIDSALDEDVAEIAEFSVTSSIEETPVKKQSFKRNLYFIIGIAVSVMSLIGFIFSVNFCASIIKDFANNTKQKEEFAKFIYPIVIVDPASYDKNEQLSSDAVISAAIWDIILYGDTSKYQSEFGNMTVPQLDVELHATNLFGTGLTFDHKTLGDAVLSFYYTPETKSYIVPISPKYFPYSPMVESIKRNGNTYSLKVGYISPSPAWLVANDKEKPEPDKYMEYVVVKKNNDYTLTAIKDIEGQNIPGDI